MVIPSVCTCSAVAAEWPKFPYFSAFSSQRLSTFLVWWYCHSPNHFYYWLQGPGWWNSFNRVTQQSFASTGHFERGAGSTGTALLQWAGTPRCQGHFWAAWRMLLPGERGAGIYRRTPPWARMGLWQSLEAEGRPLVLPAPITECLTHFLGSFCATHSAEWGVNPVVLLQEETATAKHPQLSKFLYHFSFPSSFLFVCVKPKRTGLLFSGSF